MIQAPHRDYQDVPHYKGTFSKAVNSTLVKHGVTKESMLDQPVVVNFADSLLGWSYSRSEELFSIRKELHKLLRYNRDLLSLSYEILAHPELDDGNFIG